MQTMAMCIAVLALIGLSGVAHAQVNDSSIARTYTVSDSVQPESGDLISFDQTTQALHLSRVTGDTTLFGVVVSNPVIVLRISGANVPITTSGEAFVNVTTLGGPIAPGDYITTSSVAGKGQRATKEDKFVVGLALAAFPTATTTAPGGVVSGSVPVLLGIGPYPENATSSESKLASTTVAGAVSKDSSAGLSIPTFLRYLLAAIVAVGSIAIAFRNFGSSIRDGIISVGRNPLAKASIQSMVILNVLITTLVSAAGLFIGFAILFLPI